MTDLDLDAIKWRTERNAGYLGRAGRDCADLLDEVEQLRTRIDAALALHTYPNQDVCPVCVDEMNEPLPNPCPTLTALTGDTR